MERFGDFSNANVQTFIQESDIGRISSWSKLPAFARYDCHAIYDARTAVGLNCALWIAGDSRQFHMPTGQNAIILEARLKIKRLHPVPSASLLAYSDYIEFLKKVVELKHYPCILRAEMALFANAPDIAL